MNTQDWSPLGWTDWISLYSKGLSRVFSNTTVQKHHIMMIQAYAPTSNAEEAEVQWFYDDLQDLLKLTPLKNAFFITGDWNAK